MKDLWPGNCRVSIMADFWVLILGLGFQYCSSLGSCTFVLHVSLYFYFNTLGPFQPFRLNEFKYLLIYCFILYIVYYGVWQCVSCTCGWGTLSGVDFWGKVSLSAKGVALDYDRLVVSNSTNFVLLLILPTCTVLPTCTYWAPLTLLGYNQLLALRISKEGKSTHFADWFNDHLLLESKLLFFYFIYCLLLAINC